jgi:hypothetical protein
MSHDPLYPPGFAQLLSPWRSGEPGENDNFAGLGNVSTCLSVVRLPLPERATAMAIALHN